MTKAILVFISLLLAVISCGPNTKAEADRQRARDISDMKFGMFICWSFSTFYGEEWTPTLDKDASYFSAAGCDTDQWCKVAKDAGMAYIFAMPVVLFISVVAACIRMKKIKAILIFLMI